MTSIWKNARKKSLRFMIKDKKLDKVCKQSEQGIYRQVKAGRLDAPLLFDLKAKYYELLRKGTKPATDLVCKL